MRVGGREGRKHDERPGQVGAEQEAEGKAGRMVGEVTHVNQYRVDSASAMLHFGKSAGWYDIELAWRDE